MLAQFNCLSNELNVYYCRFQIEIGEHSVVYKTNLMSTIVDFAVTHFDSLCL